MFNLNLEVVTLRQLRWFYRLLGAALGARLLTDAFSGIWRVHTGEFFPWRHLPVFPLYSTGFLALEWALLGAASLALLSGFAQRVALRLALLALAMGLSQRYSNQNALLFIVLVFSNLKIAAPHATTEEELRLPNFGLIRLQLLLVYGFSVLNKLTHGFQSGAAIGELSALKWLSPRLLTPLAWSVLALEVLIPLLLCSRLARWGLAFAILLHTGFALALPGIFTFSLTMWAMAALFIGPPLIGQPPRHITPMPSSPRADL
ncbi:MAG: hypothetical protein SFV15_05635 [Polyangiaceae bacterium]|nr:hypothetical protein [Polyangiaceae bacterium]